MSGGDRHSVALLIDAFGAALHAQDTDASMAQLDTTLDVVVIPSEGVDVYRGPEAVRAFLDRIYSGPRRYGWRLDERAISIEGDNAWFTFVGDETVEDATGKRTIPYCLTGVAVKHTSGWRLRLLHASEDASRTTQASTTAQGAEA